MGRFSFFIWVYVFDIFQRFYDYKGPRQYFFHAFIDGFCFIVSGVWEICDICWVYTCDAVKEGSFAHFEHAETSKY